MAPLNVSLLDLNVEFTKTLISISEFSHNFTCREDYKISYGLFKMKWIKLIASLSLFSGWIYLMHRPLVTSKSTIPALGNFLHPSKGFWNNGSMDDVQFGEIKSAYLKNNSTIVWDKRLVPHIESETVEDAFYLQGYTIASQRLWQMDMLSRSAAGKLAEILGERMVERDKIQRRMGMLFAAENAVEGWKADVEHYPYLKAYAQGVNDWIDQLSPEDLPIEYKLMGFIPEPWSDLKTASVVKYMAQSLCSRETDLEASNTLNLLGDSLYHFLYPSYFEDQSPIIPSAPAAWSYINPIATDSSSTYFNAQAELYKRSTPIPPDGIGSNNWAVAGSKTKSGHPILSNDPHLRLTLPSIWFENHIRTKDINAYGVSVPGIPGILIGWNDSIAWGETNVGQDVADWYKLKWTDEAMQSYELDGKTVDVNYRYEIIKVKGQPDVIDTVKYTVWGPVVVDTTGDKRTGLAYHWIAHEKPSGFEMEVFMFLMKSKNYVDYYHALSSYSNPAQNFLFASRSGDIALTVNGKFPLKNKSQGNFIQDGSLSTNAWKGFIPYAHNPRVKNPARGFVSSANQNSTDPTYPYYYNGDFDSFRGRTVNMELEKNSRLTPEHMMSMQNSTYNLKAADNLPSMIGGIDINKITADQKTVLDKLRSWNYKFDANSIEAIYFNIWYRSFYRMTFDEIYTSADSNSLQYPKTFMTGELMKKYPTHKLFDLLATQEREEAKDILMKSFVFSVDSFNRIVPHKRTWATYVNPKIQHMANLPGFSRENLIVGGTVESLNAIANGSGPSWRMVVDLGDTLNSYVVYPGGQSGNPGSKFYDNMVDDWTKGNYYHALFSPTAYNNAKLGVQKFIKK